jgi:ribosomal protein S27AE
MAGSKHCPKCSGAMSEGYVIDRTHSGVTVGAWIGGVPEKSLWTGLKTGGKPSFEVASWRCGRCGFLEHYAAGGADRYQEAQRKAVWVVAIVAAAVAVVAGAVVTALVIS